jgi:nicotinamidase-related amidase
MTLKGEKRSCGAALLLVDVINAFDFEGHEPLVEAAERAAPRIAQLKAGAVAVGVPIIYANDNFGQWRSDFRATVSACADAGRPGHRVTRMLSPGPDDYFVLKPRSSAFFGTPLELLLGGLGVKTLVIVGFAANICVLLSANDAHMRDFQVHVPADCTASNSASLTEQALSQMRLAASAAIDESPRLDWRALIERGEPAPTK